MPEVSSTTVKVRLDTTDLEAKLAALRLLLSQLGYALENALVELRKAESEDDDGGQ